MTDLVQRLRNTAVPTVELCDEAADEIERLREAIHRLADQDATLSVCNGTVTVTMDATLTDEEREAVRFCVTASLPETEKLGGVAGALCRMHAATLRGLLSRMGDCPASDNVADRNNGTTGPTNGRKVGSEHQR